MRPFTRLLCVPLLLAALLAVSAAQTRQREVRLRNCSISGRVTVGNSPAVKAKILIIEASDDDDPQPPPDAPRINKSYKVRTDDDGRYRVSNLVSGRYNVSVTSRADVLAGDSAKVAPAKEITLDDGEARENVDFALVRGGVITGRVTDAENRPLIAQTMLLRRVDEKGEIARHPQGELDDQNAETDDRGVYRIYGLRSGRYVIGVGGQGWEDEFSDTKRYSTTYHPAATDLKQAKIIEVRSGDEITDIDIRVNTSTKTYEAVGRLIDAETSKPLPAAAIVATRIVKEEGNQHDNLQVDSPTDGEGNFRLTGLTSGEYLLNAHFGGQGESGEYYTEHLSFKIADDDVSGLTLKAVRGATISGTAVIEGSDNPSDKANLSNVLLRISLFGGDGDGNSGASSYSSGIKTDGSFLVKGVTPGKALIRVWDFNRSGLRLLRTERDGAEVKGWIEIRKGEQVTGVRLVFGVARSTIRGTIKVTGGQVPEGWSFFISAGLDDKVQQLAWPDDKGRFVISNLSEGEYEVRLGLEPASDRTRGQDPPPPLLSQRVVVAKGAEAQVTFEVDFSKRLRGQEEK
jgi:hypothetical protein